MVPSQLPDSVREDADTYRKNLAAAENDRLKAQDSYDAFRAPAQGRRPEGHQGREARAAARCASRPRPRARSRCRPVRLAETDLIALYKRMGRVLRISPKTIHKRVIRGIADAPYSNVTIRTDVAARASSTTCASTPEQFKGVVVEERYLRRYPQKRARRAALRARVRDRPGAAQAGRVRGRRPGHADRPERARAAATTSTCAGPTASSASSSTRSAAATTSALASVTRAQAGPAAEADARLQPAEGRRRRARPGDRGLAATAPAPAPTWRWTRATARSWRWARSPASTRACSRGRSARRPGSS